MNFEILDQFKNKVTCNVVGLFQDETKSRNYIVYTDGTKNADGKLEVYASRYTKENNSIVLSDIEEDEEWDLVDNFLLLQK